MKTLSKFDPGHGTHTKVVNKKEGLSDETKNHGPLYLSVYAMASKRSHACSGLHTSGKNGYDAV
jgi:hypothetical protein